MLSYRHHFHAGNHADVLKHLVLCRTLQQLTQKAKPLRYIDSHAGAGAYALQAPQAQKTGEYLGGIARLMDRRDLPEPVSAYRELVLEFNGQKGLKHYPGSPWLARQFLREGDSCDLFELHNREVELLRATFKGDRLVRVHHGDGFEGVIAKVPPVERRGLVVIDPSYEIKTDYQKVVQVLAGAHRRFATGVYALWYPVVERTRVDALIQALKGSGIRRVDRYELGVTADGDGHGMTASGMIMINAPWTLRGEMELSLPYLAELLAIEGQGYYRAEVVVEE